MSGQWKLQQVHFLLDLSREHKDDPRLFGDDVDAPAYWRNAYPFLVDATMNAMFGVIGHLHSEYTRCVSTDGQDWKVWYKSVIAPEVENAQSTLGFILAKRVGARHVSAHEGPVLFASQGRRALETDDDGEFIVHTTVDWFFQDMMLRAERPESPEWVKRLARPVDELLEEAFLSLKGYVSEADRLFLPSWRARLIERVTGKGACLSHLRDEVLPGPS